MLLTIPNLIEPAQLKIMYNALTQGDFQNGTSSAGRVAAKVKSNQEIPQDSNLGQQLAKIMIGNLYANQQFKDATLPHKISQPLFARYNKGMKYGAHIDDPVMGEHPRLRCDIAMTLFINKPEEYEGGELQIQTSFGLQSIKLDAGSLVIYPASSIHSVAEVVQGQRIVGVCWLQSLVADAQKREILYQLSQARNKLLFDSESALQSTAKQVDYAYTNLVRRWSQV